MLKGSTILVTGGAGFVGINLIKRLVAEGSQVRAVLHERPAAIQDSAVTYVTADLTKMDDCRRVMAGVDYVVHCAASTSGAAVMAKSPLVHITPNVVMNAQLLETAYFAKVKRFMFLSSSAAYPPSGNRPVREDEMFNGDPYEVYYGVGWMKRFAEVLCLFYSQKLKEPMPTVVVRPSNMFGPYDKYDPKTSHVTAALIRRVVDRQDPMDIWGTGNDVRDLLYIDDFIDGLILSLQTTEPYLAVNIAAGKGYTVKEVLQTLLEVDGFAGADIRFDSTKPQMIPIRLIDDTLAREKLGFTPKHNLRDGLAKTVAWYRQNRQTWSR